MPISEPLWREFLSFCGERAPSEVLAYEFVRSHTHALPPALRALRADLLLTVLNTCLTLHHARGDDTNVD